MFYPIELHLPIETRVLVNYKIFHRKHMRKPPHHIDDPFLDKPDDSLENGENS